MKLSLVASVYNEEHSILQFHNQLLNVIMNCDCEYEIIYVNDGSTDDTYNLLNKIIESDTKNKLISFSRNFGHEAAMIAGIDHAKGDAIICIDTDLQHPPQEIPNMLKCFKEGIEIVTMTRNNKKQKLSSKLFYKLINLISPTKIEEDASDFFLISSRVAEILRSDFRERARFLRGLIQIIGFKRVSLKFEAKTRNYGETKYTNKKLFLLTLNAIGTLSKMPLKAGIFSGMISGLFSIALAIFSIIMKIIDQPVSGYTTIIVFLGFMFSIQFILIGIIGEYIGFIFDEQKKRPIYIIDSSKNIE